MMMMMRTTTTIVTRVAVEQMPSTHCDECDECTVADEWRDEHAL
jgi:hypothetical protein